MVQGGCLCKGEVIDIRGGCAIGNGEVEWGDVYDKEEGRDRGALGGSDVDWYVHAGAAFEDETPCAIEEDGQDPFDHVLWCVVFATAVGHHLRNNVVKAAFYVEEGGADFQLACL